ncbi:MAG: immune inhibitor A [Chloroflexi bacterium]|nr:immune inhibitor A [Chloroflexota bacterium]
MKLKPILLLCVGMTIASLLIAPLFMLAGATSLRQTMPANPDKILAALIKSGVVDKDATPLAKEAAIKTYLQQKLMKGDPDQNLNPMARKRVTNAEAYLNNVPGEIRGRKLGQSGYEVDPTSPQFKPLEGTDKLLLILVDFADADYTWTTILGDERTTAGPLVNQIPLPDNDFDLWVPDFSPQYYQDMLFTPGGWDLPDDHPYYPGEHRGSMHDYFLGQSYGKYTVNGDTYGWFTVDKPEAYYGDDHPDGGSDNLRPGTPTDLLADAVTAINAQAAINWLEYDLSDPYDLDADGVTAEPDCIVDHPLFVHAGIDQSGGGGAQGDDSIWAHSASTYVVLTADKNPDAACPADWEGTILYNYTIMPEDGGVGVFAHEYAHDLGLPDEYDTIYSGYGASTAFWTLQSSGSWTGRPAQTQPASMSIWARYVLGWVSPDDNLTVTHVNDLGKEPVILRLEQAETWGGPGSNNAIKVNLPDKYFFVNTPYSGVYEWFGGKADQIDTTLRRTVDLSGTTSAELSFWTWYDIEEQWDYGFVQVSTDSGATWASLPITGTTSEHVPDAMESIVANLPGFTGNSGGWVYKTFDLAPYLGQVIELQFRYMTDWGTSLAGFYLDDIGVTADGAALFFDDVETLDPAWVATGWSQETGSGYKPHYYIMEWRNLNPFDTVYTDTVTLPNFDAGLNNAYTFDPFGATPNQPYYFPYNPGLLLYYRDTTYTDNWTGAHPGGGFLLIVDAHDRPLIRPPYQQNYAGLEWDTRVQSYDAPFSMDKALDIFLTRYGITRKYQGTAAVPNFKDNHIYWNQRTPSASVITPEYGMLFRILGQADDNSAILIGLGNRYTLEEEYTSYLSDFFLIFERLFLPFTVK